LIGPEGPGVVINALLSTIKSLSMFHQQLNSFHFAYLQRAVIAALWVISAPKIDGFYPHTI
jgi:hypothetical protein